MAECNNMHEWIESQSLWKRHKVSLPLSYPGDATCSLSARNLSPPYGRCPPVNLLPKPIHAN